jgi:hypothetical protein
MNPWRRKIVIKRWSIDGFAPCGFALGLMSIFAAPGVERQVRPLAPNRMTSALRAVAPPLR